MLKQKQTRNTFFETEADFLSATLYTGDIAFVEETKEWFINDGTNVKRLDINSYHIIQSTLDFTTAEPAGPSLFNTYINDTTGTSSITAQAVTAEYLYQWNGASWTEIVPVVGSTAYDGTTQYVFNGTVWVAIAASGAVLVGATFIADGVAGIVPQPLAGENLKFLRGDATWVDSNYGRTYVRMYRDINQNIPSNTFTKVLLDSTEFDNSPSISVANSVAGHIQLNTGGYYLINASLRFNANAFANKYQVHIRADGTTIVMGSAIINNSDVATVSASTLYRATGTEIISIEAFFTANVNVVGGSIGTYLELVELLLI